MTGVFFSEHKRLTNIKHPTTEITLRPRVPDPVVGRDSGVADLTTNAGEIEEKDVESTHDDGWCFLGKRELSISVV